MDEVTEDKCRIILLGSPKTRVAKVVGLLRTDEEQDSPSNNGILIEYLPCVPTFDSYEDASGQNVRYLVKVDYYGKDCQLKAPESLLPFFDEIRDDEDEEQGESSLFPSGIAGALIVAGVGDDDDSDVKRIGTFLETMSKSKIPIERIRPNPEFTSIQEELAAFRELSTEEKAKVTQQRTMGPGKMAKVAEQFANRLIDDALEERRKKNDVPGIIVDETEAVTDSNGPLESQEMSPPQEPDPTKIRYSCRKCRTILFDQGDLQDPPHVPSTHKFSSRKHGVHSSSASHPASCQSLFLQAGLHWMGNMGDIEGRFTCPRCDTKLGTYHWSGSQCSCGSWVTPAIQVPKSRVDEIMPQPLLSTPCSQEEADEEDDEDDNDNDDEKEEEEVTSECGTN